MIIVDTSVWIHWFKKGNKGPREEELKKIIMCGPVFQELLQGINDYTKVESLKAKLLSLDWVDRQLPPERFEQAATIYRDGRRRGLTIRSPIDCLISAIAIQHNLPIMHQDRDYQQIAKFTTLLTTVRF